MSEKKLPISYNTPYSTDCRVGMKLAVVQTSPHADAWMATHLGVFMDQELEVRVGSELTEMHMDDFNDILLINSINIWDVSPDKVVDVIIQAINQSSYLMVDWYWSDQLPEADKNEIRSTTIYGYNIERKAFYALAMYEKEFCECEIPFQLLQNKYVNIKDYYTKNPAAKTLRRMTYHPLGTMRLKEYTEENSIFNALVYKIQREYSGGVSNRSNFDENGRPILNTLWFTGMDCLLGIKNKLQELMSDIDENIRFYVPHAARSSYILYEHRKRIICDMKWISDKIGLDKDERTKWVIREYKKLSNNMEILHNLLNKAWLTFDRTIMRNVIDKIEFQYKNEKMLLTEFVNIAFARYTYIQSRDFFIDNNLLFDCTSQ